MKKVVERRVVGNGGLSLIRRGVSTSGGGHSGNRYFVTCYIQTNFLYAIKLIILTHSYEEGMVLFPAE